MEHGSNPKPQYSFILPRRKKLKRHRSASGRSSSRRKTVFEPVLPPSKKPTRIVPAFERLTPAKFYHQGDASGKADTTNTVGSNYAAPTNHTIENDSQAMSTPERCSSAHLGQHSQTPQIVTSISADKGVQVLPSTAKLDLIEELPGLQNTEDSKPKASTRDTLIQTLHTQATSFDKASLTKLATQTKENDAYPSPTLDGRSELHTEADTIPQIIKSSFKRAPQELMVSTLFNSSEFFLQKAHRTLVGVNTPAKITEYHKAIKTSIQSLLMLVKLHRQRLNPGLELFVWFKLTWLYITETNATALADSCLNKALAISSRNKLHDMQFMCELLGINLLQTGENENSKVIVKYLDEKVKTYSLLGLRKFAIVFTYLKSVHLLSMGDTRGMTMIQSLCEDSEVGHTSRATFLLIRSAVLLNQGSPQRALAYLKRVDEMHSSHELPPQVRATSILQTLLGLIQCSKISESRRMLQQLSKFLIEQQTSNWSEWRYNTSALSYTDGHVCEIDEVVLSQAGWMDPDEFIIIFYFITGIALLNEAHNGKFKALKTFNKCARNIDKHLNELQGHDVPLRPVQLSVVELSRKVTWLLVLKYQVNYYQVLLGLSVDDSICGDIMVDVVMATSSLDSLLARYKSESLSTEETKLFELFIPKALYVRGLRHQFRGELQQAKICYLEVRELELAYRLRGCSSSFARLDLGIGLPGSNQIKSNELYIFSVIHLFVINEYEISIDTHTAQKQLRSELCQDLVTIFNSETSADLENEAFVESSCQMKILSLILTNIYKIGSLNTKLVVKEIYDEMECGNFVASFPTIGALAYYVSLRNATSLADKDIYLSELATIVNKVSKTSSDGNVLRGLLLKATISELKTLGESDKEAMSRLQLNSISAALNGRLTGENVKADATSYAK